MKVHIY